MSEHNTIPSFLSGGKNDITKELAYKDGKRLYKLGEDYTNERIVERIKENSYAVKFSRFAEQTKPVKVIRVKAAPLSFLWLHGLF